MRFSPTPIDGAWLIDLEPRADERGFLARAFCRHELAAHGIGFELAQANLIHTHRAGVVRGLHYRLPPQAEAKLGRCIRGAVLVAMLDMRPASPSHRRSFQLRLDAAGHRSLFVPGGVAHGYQVLEDDTEFFYLSDQFYVPDQEQGVRFDDPALGVDWPLPPRDVAERDRCWPLLG